MPNKLKEELNGMLALSFEVKVGEGVLDPFTPVRLSTEDEIERYVGPGQPDLMPAIGYVMVPNNKPNNDNRATVAIKGRAVMTMTAGAAVTVGKLVTITSLSKVVEASFNEAQAGFKVIDFVWDGGETITVDTTVLTEGIDFFPGPDVLITAQNIALAIDANVPGYRAQADNDNVLVSREGDGPNFDNSPILLATDDDGADIIVDPALVIEGDFTILDPYGLALSGAAAEDDTLEVLVF